MKKVSAVSAVAILTVAVAPLFNKASADVGTTVLNGEACVVQASASTFDVNFGSFSGSMVVSNQYESVGSFANNSKNRVASRAGSGTLNVEDTGTGEVLSVLDTCGNQEWNATVQFSDMESSGLSSTFIIPAGAIQYTQSNTLYYLGTTNPLLNPEVTAVAQNIGGDADGNDDYVFNGTATPIGFDANPWDDAEVIISRADGANAMPGEFGVEPDISIFVPQYQPAADYEGDIIVDMVF